MKRSKVLSIITILLIILVFGIFFIIRYIIPNIEIEKKYSEAQELMNKEMYEEALNIYNEIQDYKDSNKKANQCNDKIIEKKQKKLWSYIGTYDKTKEKKNKLNGDIEPFGYILEIKKINIEKIEFELTVCSGRVDILNAVGKLIDGKYKFTAKDSWENIVYGTLELTDEKIIIQTSNIYIPQRSNFEFNDEEKIEFEYSIKTENKDE